MEAFKKKYNLEERKYESNKLLARFKDRVPIIIESGTPPIDKNRYLVPSDLTFGEFMYIIRNRIRLKPVEALFGFINGKILPPTNKSMRELYKDHADEDGFLYVSYKLENTFG